MENFFNAVLQFFRQLAEGVSGQMLAGIAAAAPRLAGAFVLLLLGWLLARALRRLTRKVLSSVQLDQLVDRLNAIDLVQRTGYRIRISEIIAQTLFYVLMLIFTVAATDVLGVAAVTTMVSELLNYIPALVSAGVVLLLGLFLSDLVRGITLTACQSLGIPSAKMIATAVFYFLFITVAVSALAQARIHTGFIASNLTVVIGAGALAFAFGYGMASRDLVANYLASFYNRNKVRVGDTIRIGDAEGKVVLIDSTSMILQTADRAIILPLAKLTTEKVEVFYPEGQEDQLLHPGA